MKKADLLVRILSLDQSVAYLSDQARPESVRLRERALDEAIAAVKQMHGMLGERLDRLERLEDTGVDNPRAIPVQTRLDNAWAAIDEIEERLDRLEAAHLHSPFVWDGTTGTLPNGTAIQAITAGQTGK